MLSSRTFGYSVRHHALRAYEMGSRAADRTVVFIGAMHGNETAGSTVISALMAGKPIRGIHLWAIRRDNPDGVLSGTRRNAHDVDLNRNSPDQVEAASTATTTPAPAPRRSRRPVALMAFLDRINPDLRRHDALTACTGSTCTTPPGPPARAPPLGEHAHPDPQTSTCGGVCHGTLTQWFNKNHKGACCHRRSSATTRRRATSMSAPPRGLVRAVFGRFYLSG